MFKKRESKLHKYAKEVLKEWIEDNPILLGLSNIVKVHTEYKMCANTCIWFVPDLTVFDDLGIKYFIEICYKNPVCDTKIWLMKNYCVLHNWEGISMIEVSAKWIMDQCVEPKELTIIRKINI